MKTPDGSTINTAPDLKTMQFRTPELATPEKREILKEENRNVLFNGSPIKLHIRTFSFFDKSANQIPSVQIEINISTKNTKDVARIFVVVVKDRNEKCTATTNVRNLDRELEALGRTLWEISLKLIQQLTNKLDSPVLHKVTRLPKNGLSEVKWNELFFPLLIQNGYTRERDDKWLKTYLPAQKINL